MSNVNPEPYVVALRHAQTGGIDYLHLEPWLTYNQMKDKMRKKMGTRAGDVFDWVGLKQGERVIFRGRRLEDGSWEWEEVDVRKGENLSQETLV